MIVEMHNNGDVEEAVCVEVSADYLNLLELV